MSPLFQYRRWVYLALLITLALDAAVIFGWIRNPDLVADADPALVENLEQETALLRDEAARLERIRDSVPLMGANAETFKGQWFLRDTDGYRRVAEDLNGAARDARVALTRLTGEEHPEPDQPGPREADQSLIFRVLREELVGKVGANLAQLFVNAGVHLMQGGALLVLPDPSPLAMFTPDQV